MDDEQPPPTEADPLVARSSSSPWRRNSRRHHDRSPSMLDGVLGVINEGVELIVDSAAQVVENVEEMANNVADGVEELGDTIRESVVEEYNEVKDALVEEMVEADDGDNFFLEMSLARNLSILPGDVMNVAIAGAEASHATAQDTEAEEGFELPPADFLPLPPDQLPSGPLATPASAYFLLASAVIALSSIGPLLDLQEDCTPTMKVYWRMSATAMVLLPLAAYSVGKEGFPRLTFFQWLNFLVAAAAYATMCVGFVQALSYTSVGNAVILANSQAIMLLLAKFMVGERVLMLEGAGAVTAFVGAALCSRDSADSKPDEAGGPSAGTLTLFGDLLALLSGFGGVCYLVFAKAVRHNVPLYLFMFLVMAVGSSLTLLFQYVVLHEHLELSRDELIGIWGWMNWAPDRLPLELTMVLICNMLGALGYVRAMQYFDNLVISTAALMEPVVAEFLAFFVGVGFLPGWKGWLGNALVAVGTLAVIAPSSLSHHGDKKTMDH